MALAQIPTLAQITALYLRISDDDLLDALGVARQRKDMLGRAQSLGLPVEVFEDNNYSASRYARRTRRAYAEMVRRIEAGEVRHVVFWDLSRLVRQPKELEHLIDLAEAGTVEVHTMTGKIDLRDPDGRAMARVITTMNAKASDDTSKRIKRKQQEKREMGTYHGGGRPFGFLGKGAVVWEREAVLIREAAGRVLAGEGLNTIARDWNARGIPTPAGVGEALRALYGREAREVAWRPKTIRDALLRDLTVTAGILPAATQIEVSAVLKHPARRKQTSTVRTHLLSGVMTCHRCGGKLRSKPRNDGKPTYSCDGCHLSRLAEPVDNFITTAVVARLSGPGLSEALAERSGDDPETQTLITALEGYRARLLALEEEYEEGGIDIKAYKRMSANLEAKANDGRAALARRSESKVLVSLPAGQPAAWWPALSLDRRRSIISALVESITVLPAERGVRAFDPSKIRVIWR